MTDGERISELEFQLARTQKLLLQAHERAANPAVILTGVATDRIAFARREAHAMYRPLWGRFFWFLGEKDYSL